MWFVMMNNRIGKPMPIVDEEDNVMLYSTEQEAENAARNMLLAQAYGHEVYEWLHSGED